MGKNIVALLSVSVKLCGYDSGMEGVGGDSSTKKSFTKLFGKQNIGQFWLKVSLTRAELFRSTPIQIMQSTTFIGKLMSHTGHDNNSNLEIKSIGNLIIVCAKITF